MEEKPARGVELSYLVFQKKSKPNKRLKETPSQRQGSLVESFLKKTKKNKQTNKQKKKHSAIGARQRGLGRRRGIAAFPALFPNPLVGCFVRYFFFFFFHFRSPKFFRTIPYVTKEPGSRLRDNN